MKTIASFILFILVINVSFIKAAPKTDTIPTSQGDLVIHFLGHGSLFFEYNKLTIYVDPFSRVAKYQELPKADLILVTHSHMDHFDTIAIAAIRKEYTEIIYTRDCEQHAKLKGNVMKMDNGDKVEFQQIPIEAVPAYNIVGKRTDGAPFHPKGEGNGYVILFGDKRVYIAGDTENIPEMKNLKNTDIAFLPMNLPYTMTPEQMADAARMVHPKILYPYHYGETDVSKLTDLLKNDKYIEILIRDMK